MNIQNLAKYYKQCLLEEARISAFSNLKKSDNIVVKLKGNEKLFHNFPTVIQPQEENTQLTQLMIRGSIDKKQQLLYGYMFITGKLEDGTEIYTPLLYADCSLERVTNKIGVLIKGETFSINSSALIQLLSDPNEQEMLLSEINDKLPQLPLTEESIKELTDYLSIVIPELDVTGKADAKVHLNRESAVISATIQKGLAGTIKEVSELITAPIANSVLNEISIDCNDDVVDAIDACFPQSNGIDDSNLSYYPVSNYSNKELENITRAVMNNTITAITGGPGTGKSTTITEIIVNYILNGKSVLIASKNNTAVDVIKNKLSTFSPNIPFYVRTGGKEYRKELAGLLNDIATGKYAQSIDCNSNAYLKELINLDKTIGKANLITTDLSKVKKQITSLYDNKSNGNLIKAINTFFEKRTLEEEHTHLVKELNKINVAEAFKRHNDLSKVAMNYKAKSLIQNAFKNNNLRRELLLLSKALTKKNASADMSLSIKTIISEVLPCWLTTITDVSNSLPFIAGLFDVVIIDEASQCDIASCLPLLYRAKKAVVVGDDKQLKFLSFLNNRLNEANMKSNDLGKYEVVCDYKENSMFDFAGYFSKGNLILTKQYRGSAVLMDFSNSTFYNNVIKNQQPIPSYKQLSVVQVENGSVMSGKTQNNAEAAKVLETIKQLIEDDNTNNCCRTIGILSPFKEQVKLLEKMILNVFPTDVIEQHKIIVGTAHAFQGEERDVMLLSWTVADNSPIQSYTFINNPNLFNVAVTRADKAAINFVSVNTNDMPDGLLRRYIEYCGEYQ